MITEEQYQLARQNRDEAEKLINEYHKEKTEQFEARLKSGKPFTDDELVYSAVDLCPCGHGIAYPKECSPHHYWDCSAILKGIADTKVQHTDRLPFAFYEVKSEDQPITNGRTTRGVFRPKPECPTR